MYIKSLEDAAARPYEESHTYINTCIHTYARTCICAFSLTYIRRHHDLGIYIYICIYMHVYTYIHTYHTYHTYTHECQVYAPGVLTSVGDAARRAHGRVHFGASETATDFYGYMEGAVRAGERCAREVCDAMGV